MKTNRPRYALHRYLALGAFSNAVQVLIEYKSSNSLFKCNLWYEAAPIFMNAAPALFASALLKQLKRDERAQRNAAFDILHLLPLLLHYSSFSSMHNTHALPFSTNVGKANHITSGNDDNNVINRMNMSY